MTARALNHDVTATQDSSGSLDLSFEFNAEASGRNTRIDYKLVDSDAGLHASASVILEGRISNDDIQDLAENLESGNVLTPYKAGFPDLSEKMPGSWKDSGMAVHVIQRISYTDHPAPDYLPTTDQFLSSVIDYSISY